MGTPFNKNRRNIITIDLTDSDTFTFRPFERLRYNHLNCDCNRVDRNNIKIGPTKPKPRSGHRIVCNNKNVYLFGGYNPSLTANDDEEMARDPLWADNKPLFKELWKYNISTEKWTKLKVTNIPNILASSAVILSGSILMVYGGTGVPFGGNCSHDLFICDLKNDKETLKFEIILASGNYPPGQYGQSVVLINNYLYSIGGTSGYYYTCDIHRLNIRSGIWEDVYICIGTENEPPPRYRHETAFDGNKIYVLGGGTSNTVFGFQEIFAFNILESKWEKILTQPDRETRELYPTARRCHSSVQYEQYAYVVGGYNGRHTFNDIWRINLNTMVWKKISLFTLDRGAFFHSSCVTSNGKMLTFGGIVCSGSINTRSDSMHSAWLTIPKLKDICWEAVLHYHLCETNSSERKLLRLGIPLEYIKRLDVPK